MLKLYLKTRNTYQTINYLKSYFISQKLLYSTFHNFNNCHKLGFNFSQRVIKNQLILHKQEIIEKMHLKNQKQKQQWSKQTIKNNKYIVSLVGLPNCGKSSLFNSLCGQNYAIVDTLQGITRDCKTITILNQTTKLIDTAGIQKIRKTPLQQDIYNKTITSIIQSQMILFIIDSKKIITQQQIKLSHYIKKLNPHAKIILICNKCDGYQYDQIQLQIENYKLQIQNIFLCSTKQGNGILQILQYIYKSIPNYIKQNYQQKILLRKQKFKFINNKIKQQLKLYNLNHPQKLINIKMWQNDFYKINNIKYNQYLNFQQQQQQQIQQNLFIQPQNSYTSNQRGVTMKNLKMKNIIKVSIIGRTNVGKSTIVNEILGHDEQLVSQQPHTTRDSISYNLCYKKHRIQLIDNAGLTTPNIHEHSQESIRKIYSSTMHEVRSSHVIIYVLDAYSAFKMDDLDLIRKIIAEGRPIIIVVNKWEIVKQQYRYKAKNYLLKQLKDNLGQLHGEPIVYISAKMRDNLTLMMDKIIIAYQQWNSRISTSLLNDWLDKFKKIDQLPQNKDVVLKINYIIQAKVRPPLFVFFVNNKGLFKQNYLRFVSTNLAKQFSLDGIPLRTTLRSTNNRENKRPKTVHKKSTIKQKMDQLRKKYSNFGL